MMNYQLSSDGTIFAIQEDGSIKQLAKIDENGNITTIKKGGNTKWWVIITLLIISTIIGFALYIFAYNDVEYYKDQYYNERRSSGNQISKLESQINSKDNEIRDVKAKLSNLKSEIASVSPFVIYKVEIGNSYNGGTMETDYGNTIYSSRTMYLKPKIYYKGFKAGDYEIKVKWFRPNGSLSTGTSSPYGYSQSDSHSLSEGSSTIEFSGWGNETMGHWESGEYRLEIWYDGRCAFVKQFRIYN
jgi:hypothetical protein